MRSAAMPLRATPSRLQATQAHSSLRSPLNAALLTAALMVSAPRVSHAQDVFDAKSAGHVRDRYLIDLDTVASRITALAEAIPEDKYSWRPAPGVRSVSEVLMHVAGEFYYYTPRSAGGNEPADFGVAKEKLPALAKVTAKAQVLAELKKSFAHTKAELSARPAAELTGKIKPWGMTIDQAGFAMSGDLHEHLGQLIAYARIGRVKPPWSR